MTLYFANTSPYARKARMVVMEKGLGDRVDQVFANPFEESLDIETANPLGKVPALALENGATLFDSRVICAFLDSLTPPALLPDGAARWPALAREALADGVLDAAFAMVMERRRPEPQQSPYWLGRWSGAIDRAMDAAERDIAGFEGAISMAQIGLGSALGYLDFRLPDHDWRAGRPRMEAWFAAFSERPSMRETAPTAA